jgi:hypothetical protein
MEGHADFTARTMDFLGQVFQDSAFTELWEALDPSAVVEPPLFLTTTDLERLAEYNVGSDPSGVLRQSPVFLANSDIMHNVCRPLPTNPSESGGPSKQWCVNPSHFLFFVELGSLYATSETENSTNESYWVTVKLSPNRLQMFMRESDKHLFDSNSEAGLRQLNSTFATLYKYWDYPRPPLRYVHSDIGWIGNDLPTTGLSSAASSITVLFSEIYSEQSTGIRHLAQEPQMISDRIHKLLIQACGYGESQDSK